MKPDYKLVAKAKYIHTTADLASEIWHEVYKRYYPGKQLDTLVEELQSAEAIEADIDNDVNYFLVVLGGKNIGYFAWKMENTALHLMRFFGHGQHIRDIPQPADTVTQNRQPTVHHPQRHHFRMVDGKGVPDLNFLQGNIRNTGITVIDKTIRHPQTQCACHIFFGIDRNRPEAAKRTQIIQPAHVVIMFVRNEHTVYLLKRKV